MTLEMLRYQEDWMSPQKPYNLYSVEDIVPYKVGYFTITIFDRRLFRLQDFRYVKDKETGKYYVKNGMWVA